MNGIVNKILLFLAIVAFSSVNANSQGLTINPPDYHAGIYVGSEFAPLTDGAVAATCQTYPANSVTRSDYLFFSSECQIRTADGEIVKATDGVDATSEAHCVASTAAPNYPAQGSGDAGNETGTCIMYFNPTPGTRYRLVTKHFIWARKDPASCPADAPYVDPENFSDGDYDNDFGSDGHAFDDGVHSYYNIYPNRSRGSCYSDDWDGNPENRHIVAGSLQIATTYAQFVAIKISPTLSYFLQGQSLLFQSDSLPSLSANQHGSDSLNWCLRSGPGPCSATQQGLIQGTLSGAVTSINGDISGSETYTAPNPVVTTPLSITELYVCVEESALLDNFACAQVELDQLRIDLVPDESPIKLTPGQVQNFLASISIPVNIAPANRITADLIAWGPWSQLRTCLPSDCKELGTTNVLGLGGTGTTFLTNSYQYTASSSTGASDTLTATATITGIGTISSSVSIVTDATATAQVITFPPITNQLVHVGLTLTAAADSGLPVSHTSLTPSICTVVGSSATFLTAGTCTIMAFQPGSVNYAAAPTVIQNIAVHFPAQSVSTGVFAWIDSNRFALPNFPGVHVHATCGSSCGSITYVVDGVAWGTVPLDANGSFQNDLHDAPSSFLTPGDHSLMVFFTSNTGYINTVSPPVYYTVTTGSLFPTEVTAEMAPWTTFSVANYQSTVHVHASCNSSCGTVTYVVDGVPWGTVPVDANGDFSNTINYGAPSNFLAVGPHQLTVVFAGNDGYSGTLSNVVPYEVTPVGTEATTVHASMSAQSFADGNVPSVSVHVDCNSACGSVTYVVDGNPWGTVPLDANGNFSNTLNGAPSSFLTVGSHQLVVQLTGDPTYATTQSTGLDYEVTQ